MVVYPKAEERTGLGAPCGAFGLPWIELHADEMCEGSSDSDGMRFWQARFASATALTASISITAYNPRTRAWEKYVGTLERPLFQQVKDDTMNASRVYTGVAIRVSGITATT
jgi:hypothetical protein